jgi:hypothetical protein
VHHDALELPGGKTVLLTNLRPGQRARVLQLPVGASAHTGAYDSADHTFRTAV